MLSRRLFCSVLSPVLLFACALAAGAQTYTSIVVFGDSLSDTGNVSKLSQTKYGLRIPGPVPANYTDGRFTDGTDTLPHANRYTGVWIEQLAASFASRPVIKDSLDGGNNYAYGYASTGTGTANLDFGAGLSVDVNNMGQQVTDYLAAHPAVPAKTLIVVWGGAIDLLHLMAPSDIPAAASNEVAVIQRLINAGATDFIVPNLPPLGLIPRNNTNMAASMQANAAAAGFNQALAAGLATLAGANPGKLLHLYPLDVYTLFNNVVANPSPNGLANITAMSQGSPFVDPDTFLFWDDLHPTTTGHHLIAAAATTLLVPGFTTSTAVTSSAGSTAFGTPVTLTAIVTSPAGQATGTVTFLDGTTQIGSPVTLVAGSTATTATASLTTPALAVGPHSITASYASSGGFGGSVSPAITQTVSAATISVTASPMTIMLSRGSSGTSTITVTPTGTYSGTVALACGALPAHVACTFNPTSLAFTTASTAAQSSTLTIATMTTAALELPTGGPGSRVVSAFVFVPFLGGFAVFTLRRRGARSPRLLTLVAILSLGAVLGLSGCGGSDNKAQAGTYTVPISATSNGVTSTTNLTVTIQ